MKVDNMTNLYVNELRDLYSADKQAKAIHKRMQRTAGNDELKAALEASVAGIDDGMEILKDLCERHGKKASGRHCKGMAGLVTEAKNHVYQTSYGDRSVKDAAIIGQSQRMTHYALAGYGTAAAFAKSLGLKTDIKKLKECLDNTYEGDRRLSEIAENGINKAAVE